MQTSEELASTFTGRIRTLIETQPTVVYDTTLRDRVQLVAFSDDPQICTNLRQGAGMAGSSTVFALMGGTPSEDYRAGGNLRDVMGAAMGVAKPVAAVTAQLLDASCFLVKPENTGDTQEIATAGSVHLHHNYISGLMEGRFDINLRAEEDTLRGEFAASHCPGLLTAIMNLIPTSQVESAQAAALTCLPARVL